MLSFSLPLIIPGLVASFLLTMNKYFLQYYHGFESVAIFGIGAKFSMAVAFIAIPFRQAWLPYAFSIMNNDDSKAKEKFRFVYKIFIIIIFGVVFSTLFFSKIIVLIISNENYLNAVSILGFICLGGIMANLCGNFFSFGIYNIKKTSFSLVAYCCGLIINMTLLIILVPKYSIVGAGISFLSAHSLIAMLLYYFSNKFYKVNYDLILLISFSIIFLITNILWVY